MSLSLSPVDQDVDVMEDVMAVMEKSRWKMKLFLFVRDAMNSRSVRPLIPCASTSISTATRLDRLAAGRWPLATGHWPLLGRGL